MGKRARKTSSLLRHHRFVALEVILFAALVEEWVQAWVLEQGFVWWVKTLFVMALVLGLLTVMFTVVREVGRQGAGTVAKAGSMLFIPRAVVHLVLLCGLFYGFASSFGLWPPGGFGPLP